MNDCIIAFDAANTTGWAAFSIECAPRLLAYGEINGSTDKVRMRYLASEFAKIEANLGDAIRKAFIEDQYLDTKAKQKIGNKWYAKITTVSLRAVVKLKRVVGWYEMACSMYGWPTEMVPIHEWRRDVYGKDWMKSLDRDRAKALARSLVAIEFPQLGPLSHDICEAILMGRRCAKREWLKRMKK